MEGQVRGASTNQPSSELAQRHDDGLPDDFDAAVEEAGAAIRAAATASVLQLCTNVGRIVLDRFYGGDPERYRSHGRKAISVRKIARRLEANAGMSAAAICRSVQVHLLLLEFGPDHVWNNITPTHVRVVLALPDAERRAALLEAEASAWSIRETEAEVRRRSKPAPIQGAPMRTPRFARTTRLLERIARGEGTWLEGIEEAAAKDPQVAEETRQRLVSTIEGLERILHRLSPRRLDRRFRVVDGSG